MIIYVYMTLYLEMRKGSIEIEARRNDTKAKMVMIHRAWGGNGGRFCKIELGSPILSIIA
jgi:hypothetical protein